MTGDAIQKAAQIYLISSRYPKLDPERPAFQRRLRQKKATDRKRARKRLAAQLPALVAKAHAPKPKHRKRFDRFDRRAWTRTVVSRFTRRGWERVLGEPFGR